MTQLSHLFSQGHIGPLATKNRVVMPAMVLNYADAQGRVTAKYQAHMSRIARGGVGTMILEASFVSPEGRGFTHQLGLHEDGCVDGLRQVVAAAHGDDVRIGPQLFHAGRQTSSKVTGQVPVAPSPLACPLMQETPRSLTQDDIARIVADFGNAARRAKEAGCDFVEIHGAHGYLVAQFLSPFTNQRNDLYGGSFDNRFRFLAEVFTAVRAAVGDGFPVGVRLSGDEWVEPGLIVEDTVEISRRLEALGADILHITAGNYASYDTGRMISPMAVPDGPLVDLAERVKAAVSVPVIAVDKLRSPEQGDRLVAEGVADFIAIGRCLLADPDWPDKARAGRVPEINTCIACNQGCITRLFAQQDVWCTVNPVCSRELEFTVEEPDRPPAKVLVVGGGPAGMAAACEAAARGHKVVLCERGDRLGGQLHAAAAAPYRIGWTELRRHLTLRVRSAGVDVRLNTEATADLVQAEKADVVILATGAREVRPDLPGLEDANAVLARDVLEGRAGTVGTVVVAGGGCSGAQTAEFVAERGHRVIVVEQGDAIAMDAPVADRALLLKRLDRLGVRLMTGATIRAVAPDSVRVETSGGAEDVPADTVLLSLGARSETGLAEALKGRGVPVVVVGDARSPRRVTEAMVEGALSGVHLAELPPLQ